MTYRSFSWSVIIVISVELFFHLLIRYGLLNCNILFSFLYNKYNVSFRQVFVFSMCVNIIWKNRTDIWLNNIVQYKCTIHGWLINVAQCLALLKLFVDVQQTRSSPKTRGKLVLVDVIQKYRVISGQLRIVRRWCI